jgi:hypothetical protein
MEVQDVIGLFVLGIFSSILVWTGGMLIRDNWLIYRYGSATKRYYTVYHQVLSRTVDLYANGLVKDRNSGETLLPKNRERGRLTRKEMRQEYLHKLEIAEAEKNKFNNALKKEMGW